MKRVITLTCLALLALIAGSSHKIAATRDDKTIILRVRSADSKPVSFSGSYRSDESDALKDISVRSKFFGVKMKTETLTGSVHAEPTSPDVFVEVIEFTGNIETASVSGSGKALEFYVQPTGEGSRMSMRALSAQ
jgi:hypothetical protein